MGRCHGLALVGRPGVGPARPINSSSDGPQPDPAHQFFTGWAAARPSPSHFQKFTTRPDPANWIFKYVGPARPMTLAARPMKHRLYTGRPAISVGRPVDLTGRATGRTMCCPVLKGGGICADVFFFSL